MSCWSSKGWATPVDTEVRVIELLEPYVKHLLAQRLRTGVSPDPRTERFAELNIMAEALPGDVEGDDVERVRAARLDLTTSSLHDCGRRRG